MAHHASLTALVRAAPWKRRAVTVPSYVAAWLLVTALAPVWALVALLVGLWRRRSFVALRLSAYLWVYVTLALLTLLRCAGLAVVHGAARQALRARISCWYGTQLFDWCVRLLSLSVEVEGDDGALSGPLIVLVRHVSIIDTAFPTALLSSRHGIDIRYVLRKELVVEPCLDIVGHVGTHCFLDREGDPAEELEKLDRVAQHLGGDAVALFPEGTRFTEAKRAAAVRQLEQTKPELAVHARAMQNVLPPKTAGAIRLLASAPEADCLVIAHRGLEGLARFRDFLDGSVVGRTVTIRLQRISRPRIPPIGRQPQWLYETWADVDAFVEQRRSAPVPTPSP